ncbi:MAG: hypothetical protein ACP5KB_04240 [Thermoprotei archaeon]
MVEPATPTSASKDRTPGVLILLFARFSWVCSRVGVGVLGACHVC